MMIEIENRIISKIMRKYEIRRIRLINLIKELKNYLTNQMNNEYMINETFLGVYSEHF